MQIRSAGAFIDSFARLMGAEQKAIKATSVGFQEIAVIRRNHPLAAGFGQRGGESISLGFTAVRSARLHD